jgi:hypothetical protein
MRGQSSVVDLLKVGIAGVKYLSHDKFQYILL